MRADENKIISKHTLISVFKKFKQNPKKIFIAKDFWAANSQKMRQKYLKTLVSLGLIKEVPTIYKCGIRYTARRDVKGYRLKK